MKSKYTLSLIIVTVIHLHSITMQKNSQQCVRKYFKYIMCKDTCIIVIHIQYHALKFWRVLYDCMIMYGEPLVIVYSRCSWGDGSDGWGSGWRLLRGRESDRGDATRNDSSCLTNFLYQHLHLQNHRDLVLKIFGLSKFSNE